MVANFFIKHLQDSFFIKLRKVIMGYSHLSILLKILPSSDEEHVGVITHLATSDNVKFGETIGTKLENRNGLSVPCIDTRTKDLI